MASHEKNRMNMDDAWSDHWAALDAWEAANTARRRCEVVLQEQQQQHELGLQKRQHEEELATQKQLQQHDKLVGKLGSTKIEHVKIEPSDAYLIDCLCEEDETDEEDEKNYACTDAMSNRKAGPRPPRPPRDGADDQATKYRKRSSRDRIWQTGTLEEHHECQLDERIHVHERRLEERQTRHEALMRELDDLHRQHMESLVPKPRLDERQSADLEGGAERGGQAVAEEPMKDEEFEVVDHNEEDEARSMCSENASGSPHPHQRKEPSRADGCHGIDCGEKREAGPPRYESISATLSRIGEEFLGSIIRGLIPRRDGH